jgi:hypothetical protein
MKPKLIGSVRLPSGVVVELHTDGVWRSDDAGETDFFNACFPMLDDPLRSSAGLAPGTHTIMRAAKLTKGKAEFPESPPLPARHVR